jgi:hypothetical protein
VQAGRRFNDTKRLWLRYTARETFLCQIRLPGGEDIYAKTAELGGKMTKRVTPRTSVRSGNRRPGRTARQYFRERQTALWSLPVLLLLSGCGGAESECDSLDTRNSVVKIVSGDNNNALVNYAAKNSSVVEARVNKASTEAEKLAIWETARQGAAYKLGEAISTSLKSKDRRAVTCSGLLSATVEDATAQKQVDFKVEQTPDGNVSVSVSPFQFKAEPAD